MIVRARPPSRIKRQPRPRAPAVVDRRRALPPHDHQACAEAAQRLWRELVRGGWNATQNSIPHLSGIPTIRAAGSCIAPAGAERD